VAEQRDGSISGARQGLRFYGRCAQEAWRRSWDAANAWPPITALLVLYGGARLAGLELAVPGEQGALIGTGLFIGVAWLAVFLVQLVAAPPRLCARLDAELLALARRPARPEAAVAVLPSPIRAPEPPVTLTPPSRVTAPPPPMTGEGLRAMPRPALPALEVRLHDQVAETDAVDATGERLPASRAYVARVANRGDTPVRRCQLFFSNPTHVQVVSGPFDLAPGAHRDLPVLRVIDDGDEPHALLYFLDGETWGVAQGQAAWLPEPGRFKVKVLSANAPATALDVTLSRSAGTPLAWTLVEADPDKAAPEKTPKPGRSRRSWAAAAPSAGD
jgi:hypothetical protein